MDLAALKSQVGDVLRVRIGYLRLCISKIDEQCARIDRRLPRLIAYGKVGAIIAALFAKDREKILADRNLLHRTLLELGRMLSGLDGVVESTALAHYIPILMAERNERYDEVRGTATLAPFAFVRHWAESNEMVLEVDGLIGSIAANQPKGLTPVVAIATV